MCQAGLYELYFVCQAGLYELSGTYITTESLDGSLHFSFLITDCEAVCSGIKELVSRFGDAREAQVLIIPMKCVLYDLM